MEKINPELAEAFRVLEEKSALRKLESSKAKLNKEKNLNKKLFVPPKTLELLLNGFKFGENGNAKKGENEQLNKRERQPKEDSHIQKVIRY